MQYLTLPEYLERAARETPALGIYYIREDGTSTFQSYPELLNEARSLAGGLIKLGLRKGDKVIISTAHNRETINLLWACFMSGTVPTILQPPVSFADYNPAAVKLLNVFRQLGEPFVFISSPTETKDPELDNKLILFRDIQPQQGWESLFPAIEDLAYIQYSSGSTGDPKGIMLSHSNLAYNIDAIITGLQLDQTTRGGSWMPIFHDMGLVGYHLTPVFTPCNQYHIETIDFIKNPGLWLDMMSRYGITITGCPNFGQALVLRYLKRKSAGKEWNFSSLKALLNGAEPISVKILDEFTRTMASYGMPEEAMMPVYGMAEATLAVSFSPLMKPSVITSFDGPALDNELRAKVAESTKPKNYRSIVSVGKPLKHVFLRIVDMNGTELAENQVGHIQVRGKAITKGYFKQEAITDSVFEGDWLKTGDMGFIHDGNLFISGRFKDIIFMNGRNYYAHDLENLAMSIEEISYGKIVLGGITDPKSGKEKVLAFVAGIPESKAQDILNQLRSLLRKNLGIQLDEMIMIRSNEIPKTSSGKIQRYQLMQRYQQGDFADSRIR